MQNLPFYSPAVATTIASSQCAYRSHEGMARQLDRFTCLNAATITLLTRITQGNFVLRDQHAMTTPIHLMLECDHMQNGTLSGTWL